MLFEEGMPAKLSFISSSEESETEILSVTSNPPTCGYINNIAEAGLNFEDKVEMLKNADKSTMYSGETYGATDATPCSKMSLNFTVRDNTTNLNAKAKDRTNSFSILNYLNKTSGTKIMKKKKSDETFTEKARACSFLEDL